MLESHEEILRRIRNGEKDAIANVDDAAKKDSEFMAAAMRLNWEAIRFAHEELRRDPDFMLRALEAAQGYAGSAMQFVHKDLRQDYTFMVKALPICWQAVDGAHEVWKKGGGREPREIDKVEKIRQAVHSPYCSLTVARYENTDGTLGSPWPSVCFDSASDAMAPPKAIDRNVAWIPGSDIIRKQVIAKQVYPFKQY
jgi:hypothetical protein